MTYKEDVSEDDNAKYLTKDNNVVAKDKHIYGYSRNLKRPRKIAYLTKCTLEEILEHLKDYNQLQYRIWL